MALLAMLALVGVGDRVGALALGGVVDQSGFRYAQLYRGGLQHELLVLGNSRGVHAVYAPELTQLTCRSSFNLSYNGLSSELAATLVADYLERNRRPAMVLLEASMIFAGDDVVAEFKPFIGDSPRLGALIERHRTTILPYTALVHLYRYNSEMFLRILYYLGRSDQSWINRGRVATPAIVEAYFTQGGSNFTVDAARIAPLRAAVERLRAAGVEPVLFVGPYHPAVMERLADARGWIAQLRRELGDDLQVLDLSRLALSPAGFADPLHVNIDGSREVMAELVRAVDGLAACRPPAAS